MGVNSQKVYIGSTAGIAIFNPETLEITGKVEGIDSGSLYANQLGDMVCAGKYVFAIKQAFGTLVIDTETDKVVEVLGRDEAGTVFAFPQGVTMTADGNVWVAATSTANGKATTLYCYDSRDLSLIRKVAMPSHLSIVCGWGSWRSTNFFADVDDVAIWFGSGVEASIVSGNSGYYKWDTESDLETLEPVYVFPKDLQGLDEKTMQAPYASVRYDRRSNQLLIAATHGASSNYRYEWLHFIDCATGEIARTIKMKDYYWFPAIPIFPDKYAPVIDAPDAITLDLKEHKDGLEVELDVTDEDNIDAGILLSIVDASESPAGVVAKSEDTPSTPIFTAALDGKKLTLTPRANGDSQINLRAESNGVATYLSLPVTVSGESTGIENVDTDAATMSVTGKRFSAKGFTGHTMVVYNAAGSVVATFDVNTEDFSIILPLTDGLYIISTWTRKDP